MMKAMILVAGTGSRFGTSMPKCLLEVQNGERIMDAQLKALRSFVPIEDIVAVVGYKKEKIIDTYPDLTFVYNEEFATANNCKSLLKGLKRFRECDVLVLNGDVWLGPEVIRRVVQSTHSAIAVTTKRVADEEVKYRIDNKGYISELSKSVVGGLGEAIGVHKIRSNHVPALIQKLEDCHYSDIYEAGIEKLLNEISFRPVD